MVIVGRSGNMTHTEAVARSDAVERLLAHRTEVFASLAVETIRLDALAGRTLAERVTAPADVPPHDYATMDGYAVAVDDESPTVVADVFPEDAPPTLDSGEAARIATGAPLPPQTDAVLKREDATLENGQVSGPTLDSGTNVSPRGGTAEAGEQLFDAGTRLSPRHAALLCDIGVKRVSVHDRLSVAVVATGTEIHEGRQPDRDSDFLAGLVREWGHEPTDPETVPDDAAAVRQVIEDAAATHDVVLTTGGTSVGSADHVSRVLGEYNPLFESVRFRPGRPVTAAVVNDSLVIGLPGKPLAAHTAAVLVAQPFFTGERSLPTVMAESTRRVGIPDDDLEYAVPVVLDDEEALPLGHVDSSLPLYEERFAPGLVAANTRTAFADGFVLTDSSLEPDESVAVVPYGVFE